MTNDQIKKEINNYTWYHEIDLGNGVVTPGHKEFRDFWTQIRKVRSNLDYKNKKVLDICAYDGMFSFEAEQLGASIVVATDCCYRQYKNILFCKQALNSKVIPYFNISPHNLEDRLDVFLTECVAEHDEPYDRLFDIVQHFGLLYHVRDPMLSLSQARSVIKSGGYLVLETQGIEGNESKMIFNGTPQKNEFWPTCGAQFAPHDFDYAKVTANISPDSSSSWFPTVRCLKEMLKACLFEVLEESVSTIKVFCTTKEYTSVRVCLIAKAINYEDHNFYYAKELQRKYRNPGLNPKNEILINKKIF